MIDFRYHLVSIVSIFFALAVGIVLGAGPLQQQIGSTLTSEVTQLRNDKADLRAQLDAATTDGRARDSLIAEALPRIVGGTLAGRGVAIVILPGTGPGLVEQTVQTVRAADGVVTTQVTVTDAWTSPDPKVGAARDAAARAAAGELGLPLSADRAKNLLDRALAAALATKGGPAGVSGAAAKTALETLASAGLVKASTTEVKPAQHVVVLSAPVAGRVASEGGGSLAAWVDLSQALGTASLGTVVVTDEDPRASDDGSTSLVHAVRSDRAASRTLSTIDNGGQPLGQVSIPFALAQQEDNATGHYGLGAGASASHAPIPPS